jgi:PAS domain S-box-containing protein
MKLKNWEKVTGGRSGLNVIYALAVLSLVVILVHILNMGQPFAETIGTNVEWSELIIDFIVICAIGSISLVLIRESELKRSKIERTLSYSEERYKELFENSPPGLYRTTPDGQILLANATLLKMLGYSSFEDLTKRNLEKEGFKPEYPRSKYKEIMEKEGGVKGLESAWMRKDKTALFVRENAKAVRDEKGRILYYEGTVEDITERKKAEASLKESEEKFKNIFEFANDGIIYLDSTGRILEINKKALEIYGGSKEEVLGKHYKDLGIFNIEEIPSLLNNFANILSRGETNLEISIRNKNGQEFYLECSASLMKTGGKSSDIMVITRDITERRKVEEALRTSEQRYKLLFEKSLAGVYRTTLDGKVINCNESFARLLGYDSAEEIMNHRAVEFYFKDAERKEFLALLQKKGSLNGFEICMRRKDGKPVWILENVTLIKDEKSGQVYIQGTSVDITGRKQAEQIQAVLFNIANATNTTQNLQELFQVIQRELGKLMDTTNFFIALYDKKTNTMSLPYHVDAKEKFTCFPTGKSKSSYVIKKQEPVLLTPELREKLIQAGEIESIGIPSKVWLGVPLKIGEEVVGVVTVQSYTDPNAYGQREEEILKFVSGQIALTIERKKAEEKLRESEERYKALFERSLDCVYIHDFDGNFLDANSASLNLLGFTKDEITSTNFHSVLSEDQIPLTLQAIEELKKKGFQEKLTEVKLKHKNGEYVDAEVKGSIIYRDGKPYAIQGIARDITERKRAEEALRVAEERFSKAFRTSPDAMTISRMADGTLFEVNDMWEKNLGYSRAESMGISSVALGIWSDPAIRRKAVKQLEETGSLRDFETDIRRKTGEIRQVSLSSERLEIGGEQCLLTIIRDITERKKAEEALKESEDKYKTLSEESFDSIIIHDVNEVLEVNRAFTRVWGYEPEEVRGESVIKFITPESYKLVLEKISSGHEKPYEISAIKKDGTIFPIEIAGRQINYKGRKARIVTARDITERKQAETSLRESEERFRQFAENIDQVFWLTDWDAKKLLYVNSAYERMFGRSCQSAYEDRKSWQDVIHPEDRPRVSEAFARSAELGQYVEAEYRIVRDDGTVRWVLDRSYPIRDKYGKIYRFASVADDITERKKAEEALRESEDKFRNLTEHLPNMVFINKGGRGVYANRKCEEIMGYKREEINSPDFNFLTLIAPESKDLVRTNYARHLKGEKVDSYECTLIDKEGKRIKAIITTNLITYEGETAILGALTDITERKKMEEELRASESKYKTLLENLPQKIFFKEKNLVYVSCNENYARDLKILPDKIEGKTDYDFYPKGLAEKYRADDKRIMQTGKTEDLEEEYIQSGQKVFVNTVKTPVKNEKGEIIGVLGIFWDITERKKAEELLRTSQAQLSNAMKIAKLGYWEYDVAKDLFTFDDHFYDIFRTTAEKVGGYKMSSARYAELFVHPDDRPLVGIEIRKALETTDPNFSHQLEHRIIYADGGTGYITVRFFIVKDDKGNTVRTYGANQDITERKRAEEELRESEQKYRGVVDNIGIGVSLISPKMEILFLNKQMKKWFSYVDISKEAVCYRAFNNPPREEVCCLCPTYRTFHDSQVHESITDTPAGDRIVNYRVISSPIKDKEGKVISAIEMVEDITERKKLQEQLIQTEKLAAVGTLAYGIAHEFNNILAGMLANAELGLITDEPRQIKECFEIIADNSHRAASITKNLLVFAHQREARKELIDITEPLKSVLAITHRELEKLNIKIVEKFKPVPGIYCDAGQLSEVFLNMITNARDAMRERGGMLTIQVEAERDNIRIIFRDTGCGIPEQIKGKIFEPFVTSKGALGGSEVPGTGLGLFLSYGIINGYQGEIEVESKIGKGTIFTILIPVSKNQPPESLRNLRIEPSRETDKKLKILLVDDEQAITSSLKKFLESSGHRVTASLKAKDGLGYFKKEKFDLILTDIAIPDMDGIELIKRIKEKDKNSKIIVITGHILKEKEEKAKEAGADEVLIKPFRNEILTAAISKLITE